MANASLLPVDTGTIAVWRFQALGVAAVTAVAAAVLLWGSLSAKVPFTLFWAMTACSSIAFAGAWKWPPLAYRHLRYGLDDIGIVIHRGVVWRSHVLLPRIRIQHTDVTQNPLQRRYGLASLKLYTAGSRYTRIVLPGLAQDDAAALRDTLLGHIGDDDV